MKIDKKKETAKMYTVDHNYIGYLSMYDNKVMHNKAGRPYVGIVYEINCFYYFAPLTSLKTKKKPGKQIPKDDLTFQLLEQGKYGGIHIGNMVPVPENCLQYFDFNKSRSQSIKDALQNEYRAILKVWPKVRKKANQLYELSGKTLSELTSSERSIRSRCCNYKLLEQKCKEYEGTILCQSSEPAIVDNSLICVQNNVSLLGWDN